MRLFILILLFGYSFSRSHKKIIKSIGTKPIVSIEDPVDNWQYQQCNYGSEKIDIGSNLKGLLAQPPNYQFYENIDDGVTSIIIRPEVTHHMRKNELHEMDMVYAPNMSCNWLVDIPNNYFMRITISKLALEFYGNDELHDKRPVAEKSVNHPCRYDFFRVINNFNMHKVYNGNTDKRNQVPGDFVLQFCKPMSEKQGDQMSFDIASATNKVLFSFISDKDTQKRGFLLHYQFFPMNERAWKMGNYTLTPITPLVLGIHTSYSDNGTESSSPSLGIFYMILPMMFLMFVICHNLTKSYELEQLQAQNEFAALGRNNAWYNDNGVLELSQENIPNNVHRAQNALVRGLLQRRESVIDLSRRLIQEDIRTGNEEAAARDRPPSYENVLGRMGFGNTTASNDGTNVTNSTTRLSRASSRHFSTSELNELQSQLNVDGPENRAIRANSAPIAQNEADSAPTNRPSSSRTSFMNFFGSRIGNTSNSRISSLELENILMREGVESPRAQTESARTNSTNDSTDTVVPVESPRNIHRSRERSRSASRTSRPISPLPPILEIRRNSGPLSPSLITGNRSRGDSISSISTHLPSYHSNYNIEIPDYEDIDND